MGVISSKGGIPTSELDFIGTPPSRLLTKEDPLGYAGSTIGSTI